MKIKYIFLITFLWNSIHNPAFAQQFKHPGLLSGKEDIARIRKGIFDGQADITSGYDTFKQHLQSQYSYQMQGPLSAVSRNPTVGQTIYDSDANAAYQNAMMWAISDNKLYAKKAVEIINAWSDKLKTISGRDAVLMAGLGPFKMINAAELLRYTYPDWNNEDIKKTEKHFKEVIYPVIKNFAPFANGNWDAAALKTVMAIGIFCNDRGIFENAIRYYKNGAGDGSLPNYIINQTGQCQESGRDQAHTQLGLAHLADCCEMAWHQGLDLYGYDDNLLLKGFEYAAQYNLGYDVPFVPTADRTGKYTHYKISEEGRGKIRAIYEELYNHFVKRRGMSAPYTAEAATRIRPEPQGLPGADHIGFGTFLYSRSGPDDLHPSPPSAPAGLTIASSGKANQLGWVPVEGSKCYKIKRSTFPGRNYQIIAKSVMEPFFLDKSAKPHQIYYYTVSAQNQYGESAPSYPASIATGLPDKWSVKDIGLLNPAAKPNSLNNKSASSGTVSFDGTQYRVEGMGTGLDSAADHFTYLYQRMTGNGSITIRYVPQLSSQFSQFGLIVRQGLQINAPTAAIIIGPEISKQIEAPEWSAKHKLREGQNENMRTIASSLPLSAPGVAYSRLVGNIWLKLEKKGNLVISAISTDGQNWQKIGQTESRNSAPVYIGLAVAAGKTQLSTTVTFDHVKIEQ